MLEREREKELSLSLVVLWSLPSHDPLLNQLGGNDYLKNMWFEHVNVLAYLLSNLIGLILDFEG